MSSLSHLPTRPRAAELVLTGAEARLLQRILHGAPYGHLMTAYEAEVVLPNLTAKVDRAEAVRLGLDGA